MTFGYTVSLQIRHPEVDPHHIALGIGLTPSRMCAAGEPRATPAGSPLPGVYSESYCSFYLGGGEDGELANFLRDAIARLEQAAAFIADLRRTGGRLNFFVSWSVGDRGEVFDVELLGDMARLGIDLGIDPLASP